MATFGDIIAQVANDLARTNLNAEIGEEINAAIREFDTKRVWFNESRDLTFNTVAAQAEYTVSDNANIPNLIRIDGMFSTLNSNDKWLLKPMDKVQREWLTPPNDPGRPTWYTFTNKVLTLWPVPDAVYQIRVMGWYRLSALAIDSDTNIWTEEAADLLRHSARHRLLLNVIQDEAGAGLAKVAEERAWGAIERETILRTNAGTICHTDF